MADSFTTKPRYVRVSTLPSTGELGLRYILEPGTTEWIWDSAKWLQIESRAPHIQYSQGFKDLTFVP